MNNHFHGVPVFEVKTKRGIIWQGVASDWNDAALIACSALLCPQSAIVSIRLVSIDGVKTNKQGK